MLEVTVRVAVPNGPVLVGLIVALEVTFTNTIVEWDREPLVPVTVAV